MVDIKSLDLEELKEEIAGIGEKPFRAKQIYDWIVVPTFRQDIECKADLAEEVARFFGYDKSFP